MVEFRILDLFQGAATLMAADPTIAAARIALMLFGIALVFLGAKNILEPLIMVPMGVGMAAVNAGVLFLSADKVGTIFVDPLVSDPAMLVNILQINFLQPIYTLTFSNGLIACLVFMGIGVLCDIGYVLAFPLTSMFLAICAEFGTIATYPIAIAMGLTPKDAASIAMVGGADGPMVLFTSLILSRDLFVPIGIVAYLYLSLCYGGYPYIIRFLVPKHLRGIKMDLKSIPKVSRYEKIGFSVITCTVLCFLFPVAAPLFMSFFLGVIVRDTNIVHFRKFIEGPILYGSTFFLGLILGVLCEAGTILNPVVFPLLILGIIALFLSGVGGLAGGYILYLFNKGKYNPVIGIAGVSCVPSTAKVAEHEVQKIDPRVIILPYALGANISGVITSAIIAGIYVTLLR